MEGRSWEEAAEIAQRQQRRAKLEAMRVQVMYNEACGVLGTHNETVLANVVAERTEFTPRDFLDAGMEQRVDMLHLAIRGPHQEPPAADAGAAGRQLSRDDKPAGRATINARMLDLMLKNPECRGWTSTQWATGLKCGRSSIVEQPTWKELETIRETLKAERKKDRRHRRLKSI